jgi:23S rRNA pseudouridine955/2504/2580 synthase
VTGRTHQIRVHLAHLGTPIIGDGKYGDAEANRHMRGLGLKRLFLHAESIGLRWPEEQGELKVEAPLQHSLEQFLDKLRNE